MEKPTVVGLYGLPGSGKTCLIQSLEAELGAENWVFFEGSEMIASICPGGLESFKALSEDQKRIFREIAVREMQSTCVRDQCAGVVTGHFMFWQEGEQEGTPAYTTTDWDVFTHIIYLGYSAETILHRTSNDSARKRLESATTHLERWQSEEVSQLRRICLEEGILFSVSHTPEHMAVNAATILEVFRTRNESQNLEAIRNVLTKSIRAHYGEVKTMLVFDGDGTMIAEDTGRLYWRHVADAGGTSDGEEQLREIFSSNSGYSYMSFRQAALLYAEASEQHDSETICQLVADAVSLRPEVVSLLQMISEQKEIGAMVITAGQSRIWQKILKKAGMKDSIRVVGNGNALKMYGDIIVSKAVKEHAVKCLQNDCNLQVWAFGDSPLDLDMMIRANEAVVVVGHEDNRSSSMDQALHEALRDPSFRPYQALLPKLVKPRLSADQLPILDMTDPHFLERLFDGRKITENVYVRCLHHTNAKTTDLLATPMRNAALAGPALRKAHQQVGWYLGVTCVADVIGLEPTPIRHVLGHRTQGSRLMFEEKTTILALMRGGEPMALGVSDAFPLATFAHVKDPESVSRDHLEGQVTLILVDSVINSGKTVVDFVQAIRGLHATIRIVVVAGVLQDQCLRETSHLLHEIARCPNIYLIALRTSVTKFIGTGSTDTGNRLFNTTRLA